MLPIYHLLYIHVKEPAYENIYKKILFRKLIVLLRKLMLGNKQITPTLTNIDTVVLPSFTSTHFWPGTIKY